MQFILIIIIILFNVDAMADIPSHCKQSFMDGNYPQALSRCKRAAQLGNSHAQYIMGFIYQEQHGKSFSTQHSIKDSFRWYKQAAKQGHSGALTNLGLMHYHGKGLRKNLKKAKTYLEMAAKQDDPLAMNYLARLYYLGHGTKQSYRKAYYYFKHAAQKGEQQAMYGLATMYEQGNGLPKDLLKAHIFYDLASKLTSPYTQIPSFLVRAREKRDSIAKQLSKKQLKSSYIIQVQWEKKYKGRKNLMIQKRTIQMAKLENNYNY